MRILVGHDGAMSSGTQPVPGESPDDYRGMPRWERRVAASLARRARSTQQGRTDFILAAGYMLVGAIWIVAASLASLLGLALIWFDPGWVPQCLYAAALVMGTLGVVRLAQARQMKVREQRRRG